MTEKRILSIGRRGLTLCFMGLLLTSYSSTSVMASDESLPRECERNPKTNKVECDLPDGCKYDGKVIRCGRVTAMCQGNACRDISFEESGMQKCVTIYNESDSKRIRVTLKYRSGYSTTQTIVPGGAQSFDGEYGGCFNAEYYGGMRAIYTKK